MEIEEVAVVADELRTYISVKFPLFDGAGNLYAVCDIATDITERKRMEEAAREAKEDADQANQAKSEFLSRMSHELRTPLNAVIGFAQLLEMDALTPDQQASVGHILRAGRHLLELINEVLDIARIEAGRLSISREPVAVRELVLESVALVAPLAAERGIQVAGAADAPATYVLADRHRLKQVLLNLLANAIKYNRSGGRVDLAFAERAGGQLRFTVRDTGPGIAADRLARLFTPFERLDAEQTGVEGTGLGLALAKRLTEAMGGRLGFESTVGRGSVFWVELPLTEAPAEPPAAARPPEPGAEPAAAPRTALILYIEDNLSNLTLVQRVLARRPHLRLLPAMQGRLGLDLAREHHPDLILLDLHLPDVPGQEVLRRLQQEAETARIPVVVITADATSGQTARLIEAGARSALTKPLDVGAFLDVVDALLGEAEAEHAGRRR